MVVAISTTLVGCTEEVEETGTLKIGALMSLTGFASASETLIWEGVQLYEDWINDEGGIEVDGVTYTIEFVVEDGESSAEGAIAAATALIDVHEVDFIVGTVMPFMVTASGTVTEPAGVIRIAYYNCFMPDEYGPDTPYTFICNDTTVDYMTPNMLYMSQYYPDLSKISVLTPDDGAPPYLMPLFEDKLAEVGGLELVEWVNWPLDTTDFVPLVSDALEEDPDALYLINGWPIHMGAMLKAAREAGFEGPVFACHEDPYDILEVAGVAASDEFYTHNIVPDHPAMTPMIKEINRRSEDAYGRLSPTYVWGFNAPYVLIQAIEAADSVDPAVVRDFWEEEIDIIDTVYGDGSMCGSDIWGIGQSVCYPMPWAGLEDGEVVWLGWGVV
jgi:branched-chain amino acid transport system substrate-binding protein